MTHDPKEAPEPAISPALLAWLDQKFRQRCPSLNDRTRVVWFKAGQRAVVDFLHATFAEQQESQHVRQPAQGSGPASTAPASASAAGKQRPGA